MSIEHISGTRPMAGSNSSSHNQSSFYVFGAKERFSAGSFSKKGEEERATYCSNVLFAFLGKESSFVHSFASSSSSLWAILACYLRQTAPKSVFDCIQFKSITLLHFSRCCVSCSWRYRPCVINCSTVHCYSFHLCVRLFKTILVLLANQFNLNRVNWSIFERETKKEKESENSFNFVLHYCFVLD